MGFPAKLAKISHWLFAGLLFYMPLHILLSTWIGTSFAILATAKIFKDLLLILAVALVIPALADKGLHKILLNKPIVRASLAFGVLNLALFVFKPTDLDAAVLGLTYNTRFLVFMLLAMGLVLVGEIKTTYKAVRLIMIAAGLTIIFGLLQYFVLPADFLTHLGYTRENGVLPAFFIDDKADLPRIMSSVRDPNSYGSYLLIPLSLGLSLLAAKKWRQRYVWAFVLAAALCLVLTFSRSAWLGAASAGAIIFALKFKATKTKSTQNRWLILSAVTLLVITVVAFRHSYTAKNIIFHADEQTVLADPNELRLRFWRDSITTIAKNPLGSGPGTAGLASIKNDLSGTTLNENYYLQIAQETGLMGLGLFVAIVAMAGHFLWVRRRDWLAVALLASLVALSFTNLLVHIWANEAVAYTWWGLFGIYFAFTHRARLVQTK